MGCLFQFNEVCIMLDIRYDCIFIVGINSCTHLCGDINFSLAMNITRSTWDVVRLNSSVNISFNIYSLSMETSNQVEVWKVPYVNGIFQVSLITPYFKLIKITFDIKPPMNIFRNLKCTKMKLLTTTWCLITIVLKTFITFTHCRS